MQKESDLNTNQLISYILQQDKNVDQIVVASNQKLSQELSNYYDCISGWNPIWIQSKSHFEKKLLQFHDDGSTADPQQIETVMDKAKCLTHKLCQLSYRNNKEIYEENENYLNLKESIYRK